MQYEVRLDGIPESLRGVYHEFVSAAIKAAGANLLSLVAFGGRRLGDNAYAGEPLASVMVIHNDDLLMLERLAERGLRFGKRGVAAPLIMTPEYIRASLDTFPLELLEIQQTGTLIFGQDFFDLIRFEQRHLRLQCERELKSAQLHLRQGLLQAAGSDVGLDQACCDAAKRTVRVLRGWLNANGHQSSDPLAASVVTRAGMLLGAPLPTLEQTVVSAPVFDSHALAELYFEIKRIADIVDNATGEEHS